MIRAKELHTRREQLDGKPFHHGRQASVAASSAGLLSKQELKADQPVYVKGNTEKHESSLVLPTGYTMSPLKLDLQFPRLSEGLALQRRRRPIGVWAEDSVREDSEEEPAQYIAPLPVIAFLRVGRPCVTVKSNDIDWRVSRSSKGTSGSDSDFTKSSSCSNSRFSLHSSPSAFSNNNSAVSAVSPQPSSLNPDAGVFHPSMQELISPTCCDGWQSLSIAQNIFTQQLQWQVMFFGKGDSTTLHNHDIVCGLADNSRADSGAAQQSAIFITASGDYGLKEANSYFTSTTECGLDIALADPGGPRQVATGCPGDADAKIFPQDTHHSLSEKVVSAVSQLEVMASRCQSSESPLTDVKALLQIETDRSTTLENQVKDLSSQVVAMGYSSRSVSERSDAEEPLSNRGCDPAGPLEEEKPFHWGYGTLWM